MDFLQHQFDKFLLVFLILVFLTVFAVSAIKAPHSIHFAERTIDLLTGALIGIIRGAYTSAKADIHPPPAGEPPQV